MPAQVLDTLSLKCTSRIPQPDNNVSSFLDRWSDVHCQLPAVRVTPETEQDILDALQLARSNGLCVVVEGGRHGAFVPITEKSLCLDLSKFDSFTIDTTSQTVTVGAATLTGEVLRALAAEGYYTCLPNSNKVGVVGCFLGGGNGNMNSLRGFLSDQVVAVRLITASGNPIALDTSSTGDELELLEILRGAGQGLGVITSLTLRIFPVAQLKMTGGQIWTRRLIFPPSSLDTAASTFQQLQSVKGPFQNTMLFLRAPAESKAPSGLMIILAIMYFGPAEEAEAATAGIFTPDVVGQTSVNVSIFTNIEDTNNATEVANAHGGYKIPDNIFFSSLDVDDIKTAFYLFERLGNDYPDAAFSTFVLAAYNPTASQQIEASSTNNTTMSRFRGRGVYIYKSIFYKKRESEGPVNGWLKTFDEFLSQVATKKDEPLSRLPNNLGYPANLNESYAEETVDKIRRVKQLWDPEALFWSPLMG